MSFQISAPRRCHDQDTLEKRLACLADAGPAAITDRLTEIESEWSVGRMTKAAAGVLILVGLGLAVAFSAWWLILPAVGGLLLLQYLFSRTSWLAAAFRAMGFRSGSEIDQERLALKVLRGDFRHLPTVQESENKDDIARLEGEGGIALDPEEAKPDTKVVVKEAIDAAKN